MKSYLLILCAIFALQHGQSQSQTDSLQIVQVVETLFDAMRAGDSTTLNICFHEDIQMYTVANDRTGKERIFEGTIEDFTKAVGTPHEEIWDEQINSLYIKIDGRMATAWMNYEFYLGKKLLHKGVNAMVLVKEEGIWSIFHLIDTRRKE